MRGLMDAGDKKDDYDGSESDNDPDVVAQDDRTKDPGKRRLRRRSMEEQSARVFSHQLRGISESDKRVKKSTM